VKERRKKNSSLERVRERGGGLSFFVSLFIYSKKITFSRRLVRELWSRKLSGFLTRSSSKKRKREVRDKVKKEAVNL